MQEQLNGVITSIYTKTVKTKYGDKPVYHALIEGYDINLGFKHSYVEGEHVSMTVENGKYGYELAKNQNPNAAPAGAAPAAPSQAAPKVRSAPAFPIAKNTKDISIIRQSSLNRAVESVTLLIHQDVFKFSTEQEYLDKVIEVALFYTDFGSGQREVNQAAAISGYEEK